MEILFLIILIIVAMVLMSIPGIVNREDNIKKVEKTDEFQQELKEEFTYLVLDKKEKDNIKINGVIYNGLFNASGEARTNYYLICKNKYEIIFEFPVTTDAFYKAEIGQSYYFEPINKEKKEFLKRYLNNKKGE